MSTISFTKLKPEHFHHEVVIVTWAGMRLGDDGAPLELAQFADRTVQVSGTFGVGGSVSVEGSIDGVNYAVLSGPHGSALAFSGPSIEAVTELVRYIRPRVTGGDGTTNITVSMLLKGVTR